MAKTLFLLIHVIFCFNSFVLPDDSKTLNVVFVREPIKIDGKLNEGVYKYITPVDKFVQYHPQNGGKPTFKTQVYAFYDKKNMYFSFRCFDEEPAKITADVTPFGRYVNNDEINVYIDTFRDKRTYKDFSVNPRGVKKGEQTVWDADAKITDFGWSAEIKIPFKSLRFPVRDIQNWTVNFKRKIFRLNETSYWTQVERDKMNVFGDTFGELKGIRNIKGGKNIEIFPYTGYRHSYSRTDDETDSKFAYGLDLKYGITSNLTLDLTSSPDYSQVESDPFFYQITPFEYNLQENRPFYSEASNYFDTEFTLFYSRRIENPTFAVKLTGKEKGYSLGVLFAKNHQEGNDSYHGVFRLKKDIFKLSTIGIIYSSIEEKGNWNRNVGFDFSLRFKDIYRLSGMVAYSYNKDLSQSNNGMYRLTLIRDVDKGFTFLVRYERIEPNLYVPAGFVSWIDYQDFLFLGKYSFRWEGKWLEKLSIRLFKLAEQTVEDSVTSFNIFDILVELYTKNQFHLNVSYGYGKIRPQIFDEQDELVWASVLYPSRAYHMSLSYEGSPVVQFGLSGVLAYDYVYNEDFTGTREGRFTEASMWTNVKISPQLQLNLSYNKTFYKSQDKTIRFNGDLVTSTLNYQITKKLSSFVKFQYDSYLERFQYDFLIGYEPANVSKVYFSIKNYSEGRFRFFKPDASSLAFKVSYLIRI